MTWNALDVLLQNLRYFDSCMAYKDGLESFYKSVNNVKLRKPLLGDLQQLRAMYRHDRQFEYNSFVITLYGYLELFIESIIKDYIDEMKTLISRFSDLNKHTAVHYRQEMLAMYNRRKTPQISHLTDAVISENLFKTLNSGLPEIFPEAFYQSGGNYNFSEITECFKALGLSYFKNDIRQYDPLRSYFNSLGLGTETKDVVLYQKLEDLVKRRNEIAHGYNQGNILSKSEIKQYKTFLKIFCETIASLLTDHVLEMRWSKLDYEVRCSHMYSNNLIQIKGDFLAYQGLRVIQHNKGSKPEYIENEVLSLSVNDALVKECLCQANTADKVVVQLKYGARRGTLLRFN